MNINVMTNYELIQQKELKDLKSEGYLLRHKKSGARVLLMENDDEHIFECDDLSGQNGLSGGKLQ